MTFKTVISGACKYTPHFWVASGAIDACSVPYDALMKFLSVFMASQITSAALQLSMTLFSVFQAQVDSPYFYH